MVGTNSYVAKLKAQLDRAIIQREHWKQLAENRNSILVTEVCPESRSVEKHIIDADSVRASWRLMRGYREQIEALRAENGRLKAELSGVLTGIATESQAADHYRTQLEAARGLLRHMRHAATINPSCQFGMANPCRCMFCVGTRVNAFLTATPAPEASVVSQQFTAEQGERQEAVGTVRSGRYASGMPWCEVDWHVQPEPPNGTPLYTTPQPGPDVRALVEALRKLTAAMACHDATPEEYNALVSARAALATYHQDT